MARWAPDARDRLQSAALALFVESGFDQTTVAQIAERAGLNRATFFRHFTDKREVLFGGEDTLTGLFAGAVRQAPVGASLAECVRAAVLSPAPLMTAQQRVRARQRMQVLAANPEVQERGLLKHARISAALHEALVERGFDDLAARLAAEVGLLAFRLATERWVGAEAGNQPFSGFADAALADVYERMGDLSEHTRAGRVTPGQRS
ncbi:MAG: TetR family transcriptional regulator [Acidobacteriota bacterium]|nr:TetR family transcriptional regulator [Acidobacteriota bacterium]